MPREHLAERSRDGKRTLVSRNGNGPHTEPGRSLTTLLASHTASRPCVQHSLSAPSPRIGITNLGSERSKRLASRSSATQPPAGGAMYQPQVTHCFKRSRSV